MKNFTAKEIEIIRKALDEYEENHYEYEDGNWQRTMNDLTSYFRNVNEEELFTREAELIIDEEDIELYTELAEDLTNGNKTKDIAIKNKQSVLAIVAYGCINDIEFEKVEV